MYDKKQIETELKKQLAIDFNCGVEDFDKTENIITAAKDNPGRRVYLEEKEFFFHGYPWQQCGYFGG